MPFVILSACALFAACSSGGEGGSGTQGPVIALSFSRVRGSGVDPFIVRATVTRNGAAVTGLAPSLQIAVNAGSVSSVTEEQPGVYAFTVTPTRTGEYPVSVTVDGVSASRTALVFDSVDPSWGQPEAVRGLVNTPGWEDGVTVTPDGAWLFVQYAAAYFSSLELFKRPRSLGGCGGNRLVPTRCSHPWLDQVIGPTAAPERPGLPTGRISGGIILHNAASWNVGIDQAPNLAVTTAFFGFRRQTDGSYAEPFAIAFDDMGDGLIGPYGMSFRLDGGNQATMVFALDDPSDPDLVDLDGDGTPDVESFADVYTTTITLGQPTNLGTFVPSGTTPGTPPQRGTPFPSTLVDFGHTGTNGIAGTQGNPHLHAPGGVIRSIWVDDEHDADADRGEISVHTLEAGAFPGGTWSKTVLPAPVNQPDPSEEAQPFFTGTELFFSRSVSGGAPSIYVAGYTGGDQAAEYANPANWQSPRLVIGATTGSTIDSLVGVAEPNLATIDGVETLFFIYVRVRDLDAATGLPDLDLQAGLVRREP